MTTMETIQLERVFNFAVCAILVASCLQLLAAVEAKPLPARSADDNATSWENQTLPEDNCQCNGTNLTMMVDGHFLYKWRTSFNARFNHDHSIRRLSEAARNLADGTIDLQVCIVICP